MALLIKSGRLVDPKKGTVNERDLLVEKGRIARILPPGSLGEESYVDAIDASGMLIVPGLVDMHVHLREPGQEHKETIESGSRAAVAGGVTSLACMPNTRPPNDCRAVTEKILESAEKVGLARVYPVAAITLGQSGERLTDFVELREAGAVAVSDDGRPVVDSGLMRKAMEHALGVGLPVISHCEDPGLSRGGVMHEGAVSARLGLQGIPAASEEIMVFRDIALAQLTGAPVHIAHVSTRGSVGLIERAKDAGIPVTAETAPHYFTLDHHAVMGYNGRAKVNPPLRTQDDVRAIKGGLARGVIDVIATDHAPHSRLDKDVEFEKAAFGLIGLQSLLPLTLDLVREGVLELEEAVRKLTCNPATILGVPGGTLEEGNPADLALVDMSVEYEFREEDILSKSKNSPFFGRIMKGRNELTMVGGKIVWRRAVAHSRRG